MKKKKPSREVVYVGKQTKASSMAFSYCGRSLLSKLFRLKSTSLCSLSTLSSPESILQQFQVSESCLSSPAISSRVFSSGPFNLDEAQVPAAIDYRSILEEDEYHQLADATISDLQEKLEEYGDSIQVDGFDIDYGNQVLTLKLGSLGTYVLNKQTPNRQLWLSSPVSGPSRFDWDRGSQGWVYRRTKADLLQLLQSELEQLCGQPIKLK